MVDKKLIDKFFKFAFEEIAQIRDISSNAIKAGQAKQPSETGEVAAARQKQITYHKEVLANADKQEIFLKYVQGQFVHVKNDKYILQIDRSIDKQYTYDCINILTNIKNMEHIKFVNPPVLIGRKP